MLCSFIFLCFCFYFVIYFILFFIVNFIIYHFLNYYFIYYFIFIYIFIYKVNVCVCVRAIVVKICYGFILINNPTKTKINVCFVFSQIQVVISTSAIPACSSIHLCTR